VGWKIFWLGKGVRIDEKEIENCQRAKAIVLNRTMPIAVNQYTFFEENASGGIINNKKDRKKYPFIREIVRLIINRIKISFLDNGFPEFLFTAK
jgi:hypothetical protein